MLSRGGAMDLNSRWEKVVSLLDYAFQPIVNIHTGSVFGFEALLREWDAAGYGSIKNLFDRAYEELYVCREIGCDFVQGYLIQRPVTDITKLRDRYTEIEALIQKDKRYRETSQDIIYRRMECLQTVRYNQPITEVLEKFRADRGDSYPRREADKIFIVSLNEKALIPR